MKHLFIIIALFMIVLAAIVAIIKNQQGLAIAVLSIGLATVLFFRFVMNFEDKHKAA